MATAWQTLEEAALTLGISSRTLHRRMAKGEFQTRLEAGRREVLITIGESPLSPPSDASATSAAQELPAVAVSEDIQHSILALHEDRIRRTDLAIMAYQQSVNTSANH